MTEADFQYESENLNLHAGDLVEGSVTRVEAEKVWVDFGYKREGEVSLAEWSDIRLASLDGAAVTGATIRVVVLSLGEEDRAPQLSRKRAVEEATFARLQNALAQETVLSLRILAAVKGGLVADVEGMRAFLPASLLDVKFVENLEPFVGETLDVMISELDIEHRRVILSRKKVMEKQEQEERKERLGEFHVGDVIAGKVARLTSFGAFVDIGGVDGLLHVSEMSWGRVNRPDEIVHVGDSVRVKILQISPEAGKISLSLKTEDTNPWNFVQQKFRIGDIVKGTVKRLSSFGAFVEIGDGIEGLVHVSQIASHRVERPSDVLKPGDEVLVKILDIKPEEGRVSLSIREAGKAADKKAAANWEKNQESETHGATLGELVGDALREKFKL